MKYASFFASALLLLFTGRAVSAEDTNVPVNLLSDSLFSSVTANLLKTPPISKVSLGNFVVELGHSTLADVQKITGLGTIQHHGDAGGSEYWLCYAASVHGKSQHIWFSSGEMGGDEHVILEASAKIVAQPSTQCPELPAKFMPVSLANSLWLGASAERLETLLGKPSANLADLWIYSYAGKISANGKSKRETQFDVTATFVADVRDGEIVAFSESQLTSN